MSFLPPGNRLYYYCKLDTAIEFILSDKRLLLNPIIKTNDPRENRSFVFSAISQEVTVGNLDDLNTDISNFLRSDCKVLCFSNDERGSYWGYGLSRMWALYGGNHTGVCIDLDRNEFIKENAGLLNPDYLKDITYAEITYNAPDHKQVDYTMMKNMGKEKYLKEVFRQEHLDYLFFTKNDEWSSEHETRLIHFSLKSLDEYCSIRKSLRNIYLGIDFNCSHLQSIIDLCPETDIHQLDYTEFKLIPHLVYNGASM